MRPTYCLTLSLNQMKRFSLYSLISAASLSLAAVPAFADIDFGNIAFVGDSITQGGGLANSAVDKSLSYRYPDKKSGLYASVRIISSYYLTSVLL